MNTNVRPITEEEARAKAEEILAFEIGNLPRLGELEIEEKEYVFPLLIRTPRVIFDEDRSQPQDVCFLSKEKVGTIQVHSETGEVSRTSLREIQTNSFDGPECTFLWFSGVSMIMMAGAKEELEDSMGNLQEPEAELVLSFVHYLRAKRAAVDDETEEATSWVEEGARVLLILLCLQALSPRTVGIEQVIERLSDATQDPWLGVSKSTLARDWERPEEQEAWSNL